MAQYADDCPSNKVTVCYRQGGSLCQEIMARFSLKKKLCVFIFLFLHANSLRLLHDYFIFGVLLIELTKFSSNIIITINNKLWIITEIISFYKFREWPCIPRNFLEHFTRFRSYDVTLPI